jgi:GTPase SAR1 family protein
LVDIWQIIIKALKEQNSKNFELDEGRVQMLKAFFNDGAVQTALKQKNKYDLNDNYEYFVNNLDRFARSDYRPTLDDVLRTRLKTVGIVERDFNIKGKQGDQNITFKLVDVGGQRNERRKWIHAFSNVTLIMFVASLSEYDQVLAEDSDVNRMKESLDLFEFICTHESFYDRRRNQAKGIILFLNKRDLFEEKLKVKPITECAQFQGYGGDNSYKQCYEYIEEQYRKKNPHSFRSIYPHATCATDTGTMRHVFDSCRASILQAILSATRML